MDFQNKNLEEQKYLDLLKKIWSVGELKPNRTENKTKSIFGEMLRFQLYRKDKYDKITRVIPLITTKFTSYDLILKELLFFISGKTDTKILEEQKVKIWEPNTSKEFLEKRNLDYPPGCMGPGYSHQWRHFNAPYTGPDSDYTGKGIDQLAKAIDLLKTDPFNRRIIVSSWNPEQLDQMALPPCHILYQFNVRICTWDPFYKILDCMVYQRSADLPLGIPFNLASYASLVHMVSLLVGMIPGELIYTMGDCHIYENQLSHAVIQFQRNPYPFPELEIEFSDKIKNIEDFKLEHFKLKNYQHHERIYYPFSV